MAASTNGRSDQARLREIVRQARGEGGSATAILATSPLLVRLASKLGVTVNELAMRLTGDTIRRTKYPVLEVPQKDGSTIYLHDHQVYDGPQSR